MNKELRVKLKKIDTDLSRLGYRFGICGGNFCLFVPDSCGIESWIAMRIKKTFYNDGTSSLYFYAEPCRMRGGTDVMKIELAEEVCKYWKKLINLAKEYNSMNIRATSQEYIECINYINNRKFK